MVERADGAPVGIGLRIKTGRAVAVVLEGDADAPRVLARCEVALCDPDDPATRQPYHAVLGKEEEEAAPIVARLCGAVEEAADRALDELLATTTGGRACSGCIGLVVGSDGDPARIGNPHVRAHALEGRLYRRVVEQAAERRGIRSRALVEKRAFADAAPELGLDEAALRRALAQLGKPVGPPWRGDEKMAALGAWLSLRA